MAPQTGQPRKNMKNPRGCPRKTVQKPRGCPRKTMKNPRGYPRETKENQGGDETRKALQLKKNAGGDKPRPLPGGEGEAERGNKIDTAPRAPALRPFNP